jgi:drug/metabolite transporter (DMT)-like permease
MIAAITGPLTCLAAAATWALAVLMFRSVIAEHGARVINLCKCVIATVLLTVTVVVGGSWPALACEPLILGWLVLSGLLGLTLGDTALFAAVARIGVHRTLLVQTTAPLFAAALALPLGERLGAHHAGGGVLILLGVALVVAPGRGAAAGAGFTAGGVLLASLAAFGQGSGVVVAKLGMVEMPVVPATLVRLAAASVGLAAVEAAGGRLSRVSAVVRSSALRRVVPASVLGTYLAMLLMMAGIHLAPASVAAVLLATTPVFGLVFESVADRSVPSTAGVVGTALAVVGAAVLSAGSVR